MFIFGVLICCWYQSNIGPYILRTLLWIQWCRKISPYQTFNNFFITPVKCTIYRYIRPSLTFYYHARSNIPFTGITDLHVAFFSLFFIFIFFHHIPEYSTLRGNTKLVKVNTPVYGMFYLGDKKLVKVKYTGIWYMKLVMRLVIAVLVKVEYSIYWYIWPAVIFLLLRSNIRYTGKSIGIFDLP